MIEVLNETKIRVERDLETKKIRILIRKGVHGKEQRWVTLWEEE